LRRKSQKAIFNTCVGTYLRSLGKNKSIMVLVVCCCGLRTELRTPFIPEKSCTNSRTIFKADVYNKYVCAPSSNFPKSFAKILKKQSARGPYCTNTRIADEFAAIPDRKFAAEGADQQFFFFFHSTSIFWRLKNLQNHFIFYILYLAFCQNFANYC
jgi:hypothetical protein